MIRVLGPLQVVHGETPVDIGSPRHREVLAALAVDAGRVVPTETLLERVWGDGARGATTANLHAVISRLRGPLRAASRAVEIATAPPGYRLDAPGAIDAEAFQDLFARARSARAAANELAAELDLALGRHDRVLDRLPARASQRLGRRRKWKKFFMQCRVLPPPFVVLVRLQEPHGKEA